MTAIRRRLLVFAREPSPGKVKTRLIPTLGAAGAAALYDRLLEGSLAAASSVHESAVELWYDAPDGKPPRCRFFAGRYGASLHRQPEGDLGARMLHAFSTIQPTPECPALLIGSDCPGYTAEYLSSAFAALNGHDAVLGPATDGGYVLLGLTRLDPLLFTDIPWGTGDVLSITRTRLDALQWRRTEQPPLRDIDRPSDLAHFPLLRP